jgi:hypothetical protein
LHTDTKIFPSNMDELLKKNPGFKLLSRTKFMKVAADEGIDRREAAAYYDTLELGEVYKPRKKRTQLRITAPPYSFQIDVIELPKYKRSNNGVSKFLLVVDILSRKAFAYPLTSGRMDDVIKVFESFVIEADHPINSVAGDAFFDNKEFKDLVDKLGAQVYTDVAKDDHITTQGDKLGILDRTTRTLKRYIQKHMLAYNTTKWTEFLPEILEIYNNSPHSAHRNATPNEVYDDEMYVKGLYNAQRSQNAQVDMEFKEGDKVRLMKGKAMFEKEKQTYSTEVYTVEGREGNRFVIDGVKRMYRPSEMIKAKATRKMINKENKETDEKAHKNVMKLKRMLGSTEAEAELARRDYGGSAGGVRTRGKR